MYAAAACAPVGGDGSSGVSWATVSSVSVHGAEN
jgi:hypothetical protein